MKIPTPHGRILGKWQAQRVDKCEGATMRYSEKMRIDRALYRIFCGKSCQSKVREGSPCRHSHRFSLEDCIWLVCGLRRSVQLEGSPQSLCHTRQLEPPRSKSVSSARCTASNVRQLDQCAQAAQSRSWYSAGTRNIGSE